MNNRPIGIFDSGVGGLSVVRELRRQLPGEELLYLCDRGALGTGLDSGQRERRTLEMIGRLLELGVKAVVCANSEASICLDEKLVRDQGGDVILLDVIRPAARAACGLSAQGRIGVAADPPAIRSGAFAKAIHSIQPAAKVVGAACPLLIPLAEEGRHGLGRPAARQLLERYLAPLARERIDTLLLGSTHFTPFYDSVCELLQYRITVVEVGAAVAHELQARLCAEGMLTDRESAGEVRCIVKGEKGRFMEMAKLFLGEIPCRVDSPGRLRPA